MTKEFKEKIRESVELILSLPFSGTLIGESWEHLIADAYSISHVPKKLLYDVIDIKNFIGLSVKTIFGDPSIDSSAEPIIARADVFSKANELGFDELSTNDHPKYIGDSLIRFWNNKVETDAKILEIKKKKISILVKSRDLSSFAYFEKDIDIYDESDFEWAWTDNKKLGLQGKIKGRDYWKFKWSSREHQLFEKWLIPRNAYIFEIEPKHFTMAELKEALNI